MTSRTWCKTVMYVFGVPKEEERYYRTTTTTKILEETIIENYFYKVKI